MNHKQTDTEDLKVVINVCCQNKTLTIKITNPQQVTILSERINKKRNKQYE